MRSLVLISLLIFFTSQLFAQELDDKAISLFNLSLQFELNNDQGDISTRDYLKQYGTKGKSRAHEEMYPIIAEFFFNELDKLEMSIRPFTDLADVKANPYGLPSMSLGKAIKSKRSERYLRIVLKDIGQVTPGQLQGTGTIVKIVKIRCRIQLYDENKNLLKYSEGFFATGDKVGHEYNVGVDLRQYQGSGRLQEFKFFEVCCKMAYLLALKDF